MANATFRPTMNILQVAIGIARHAWFGCVAHVTAMKVNVMGPAQGYAVLLLISIALVVGKAVQVMGDIGGPAADNTATVATPNGAGPVFGLLYLAALYAVFPFLIGKRGIVHAISGARVALALRPNLFKAHAAAGKFPAVPDGISNRLSPYYRLVTAIADTGQHRAVATVPGSDGRGKASDGQPPYFLADVFSVGGAALFARLTDAIAHTHKAMKGSFSLLSAIGADGGNTKIGAIRKVLYSHGYLFAHGDRAAKDFSVTANGWRGGGDLYWAVANKDIPVRSKPFVHEEIIARLFDACNCVVIAG